MGSSSSRMEGTTNTGGMPASRNNRNKNKNKNQTNTAPTQSTFMGGGRRRRSARKSRKTRKSKTRRSRK